MKKIFNTVVLPLLFVVLFVNVPTSQQMDPDQSLVMNYDVPEYFIEGEVPAVDLVNGISSVYRLDGIETLSQVPSEQRLAFLQENFPDLEKKMIAAAILKGEIPENAKITSVGYTVASGSGEAYDAEGIVHAGFFQNQPIAFIYYQIDGEECGPVAAFVACNNGMISIESIRRTPQQLLVNHSPSAPEGHIALYARYSAAQTYTVDIEEMPIVRSSLTRFVPDIDESIFEGLPRQDAEMVAAIFIE